MFEIEFLLAIFIFGFSVIAAILAYAYRIIKKQRDTILNLIKLVSEQQLHTTKNIAEALQVLQQRQQTSEAQIQQLVQAAQRMKNDIVVLGKAVDVEPAQQAQSPRFH